MTLEEARTQYPELVSQIIVEARAERIAFLSSTETVRRVREEAIETGRRNETARILGIMDHALAAGCWELGLTLASRSERLSVDAAVEIMKASPRAGAGLPFWRR